MEKATAELDGTIVFNYIDDDIQIVETAVTERQPTKETKPDTSFDENQNSKAIPEGFGVDKLIKKEKDLIILLENEVLTPVKLEPPEETISQNSTKDANKKERRKRVRSSDPIKPPKTKKLKTKDTVCKNLTVKKLEDSKNNKKLENFKPKRGRPRKLVPSLLINKKIIPNIKIKLKKPKIKKGLGNKKVVPKIIIKLKHIPKQTKKGIKAKKQYAVIESCKPKRGRPKKQVPLGAEAEFQASKSVKKKVLKGVQKTDVMEKDITFELTKKHTSKSLEPSNSDAPQSVEHCPANELVSTCMELKQDVTSMEITQSQPEIMNGPSEKGKSGHVTVGDLGPSKPKRGRPVGSGRKSLNLSSKFNALECPEQNKIPDSKLALTAIDIPRLHPSSTLETPIVSKKPPASVQSRGVWLTKPKQVRSKSLETNKADVPFLSSANKSSTAGVKMGKNFPKSNEPDALVDLTEPQISIIKELMAQAAQQIAIIENKPKPKRGRPKSLGTKIIDSPEVSKAKKLEMETLNPRQSETVVDLTKTCQQTATVDSKSLGTKKQTASVKSSILPSAKPKPGRAKSLGSKNVPLVFKLAEPPKIGDASKQLQVSFDLTKSPLSKIDESSVEAGKSNATVNLVPVKLNRGRPKVSETITAADAVVLTKPAKTKEVNDTSVGLKQQNALVDLTKSLPSNTKETGLEVQHTNRLLSTDLKHYKTKRSRPRGLEPKKLDSSALKMKKCTTMSIPSRRLDALMDLSKSQLYKVEQANLKAKLQNGLVDNESKPKRGRPKGYRLKKHITPLGNTDPQASRSGKADIDLVTSQLSSSLVISDVGSNMGSSKALTLKALGLEAKQAISSHLVPFKGRKLRAKALMPRASIPGTKKTTVDQKATNSWAKNNVEAADIKPDITKLTKNLKTSKGPPKLVVPVKKVNIGHPKRKRGRPKGALNKKINPLALMVRLEPLKLEGIEFTDIGPSTSLASTCSVPSQSNMLQSKSIEARKVNVPIPEAQHRSSKCKENGKTVAGAKGQNATEEAVDKRMKDKNVKAKRVSFADTTKSLKISTGSETKNKSTGEKMQAATMNMIDLATPKDKKSQDKAPQTKAFNSAEATRYLNLFKTSKSLRVTKIDASKKITSLQPNETIRRDLQPPNSTTVTPKASRAKKTVVTIEPHPSTSNGIVDTIDLELSLPRTNDVQSLIRKINVIGSTKGSRLDKARNMTYITKATRNLQPSQDKEAGGKRKRRDISVCEGNKDFIFPKPKRVKRVLATNTKSVKPVDIIAKTVEQMLAGSVGSKEPSKPEEILPKIEDPKDNASADTKDEPSKLLDVGVESIPKKIMCTVGTQTIEIPDDDNKEDAKVLVETVGGQILESAKPKEDKDCTGGINTESHLPTVDRKSNSDRKNEKVDDTDVKSEDVLTPSLIQPTVTINLTERHQEHGVKFESVEQIHTEFKYESQSEHEDLLRRRRGKLGGPMRGRRRRPKEEPTSINSFVRIIDLNGKIQLKCYNQIYKCDHCLYVGNSKANLDRHSLVHRSPDEIIWFQCTECPYRSKYEHQLKSHFLIHLKPEQIHFYQCPHCEAKCSRKHNLANHIRSIHSSREYTFRCAECDYTTFSKERLVAHLRKHSKEVHACTQCKFVTKRLEYLRSHFKMKHLLNPIARPFPCDTCSYKGKTKRELSKHFDRMHNKDRLHVYQCNHCTFNSIYKKNLEFHLLHMHNNSEGFQKFICGHCQKTFSYKNGLKVHIIRCHLQLPDEEWHKCLECKYKSKDVSTLKRHIKRNHGAPRLHCKLCGFATNRQVSMDAHVKTHEYDNEDILKCPECPYRILQMSSFLYHMKVIHGKPITSKEGEQYYIQEEC